MWLLQTAMSSFQIIKNRPPDLNDALKFVGKVEVRMDHGTRWHVCGRDRGGFLTCQPIMCISANVCKVNICFGAIITKCLGAQRAPEPLSL